MIFKSQKKDNEIVSRSVDLNDFLLQQYRSMSLDKLHELADNLTNQLTLINSVIHEKCPDQEVQ